ncbi:MAG: hypothetical protein DSY58_07305 [Desulfobulbus sp.]|nr:MAG: hypothetical protein DSY58_07305 [Desulfobulbus sp.]
MMHNKTGMYVLLVVMLFLGGCAGVPGPQVPDQVAPLMVEQELSEESLLNVSIRIFEPGQLPSDAKKARGLSRNIREAEARFIPIHLKYTLQRTGYWGMVRVVPDDDVGTDLLVKGRIVYSDGESLTLEIEAVDSTNRLWLKKQYAETASPQEHEKGVQGEIDVFQDMFYTIANDLALARQRLTPDNIAEIRHVAELRYASTMIPDAFADNLRQDNSGRYHLDHMPDPEDPMLNRLAAIQARDDLLLDTINGYYDAYYQDLWEPYTDWRKFRTEELITLHDLERQAMTRQVLGAAAIVGAIALGLTANADTIRRTGTLRDVMVMGGAAAIYSGSQKREESKINREVIEELGASFSSEAEPLVVEVQGETMRLTGTAEQQYARWRSILREMYARESGLLPPSAQDEEKNILPEQQRSFTEPLPLSQPIQPRTALKKNEDK